MSTRSGFASEPNVHNGRYSDRFPGDAPATIRAFGWLGEIEGLKVSLAGTEEKLAQIGTALQRQEQAVHLGIPAFPDIAGRSVPPAPEGTP